VGEIARESWLEKELKTSPEMDTAKASILQSWEEGGNEEKI